jgi:hypothetical protein
LEERYCGNSECGHLRRFICGQGTALEYCMACYESELKSHLAKGVKE